MSSYSLSSNNLLYCNDIGNNTNYDAYDDNINQWDDGSVGNYYSDYAGTDADGNGIGDTPYLIPGGSSVDRYPLMVPWEGATRYIDLTLSHLDISFSNPTPRSGETITISATAHNIGNATANNVTVQFSDNGMQIGSDQMIHSIDAGGNGTAQVTWTAAYGSHNISVMVDPYDEIAEENETNNSVFRSIAISIFTAAQAGDSWIVEPVIRDQSIANFYDYRSESSHTGFEEPYISKIYLYQCNTSGELGLIIHHHKDGIAGSGSVKMDLQDVPADASVAVADDRSSEFSLSQEPEGNWDYSENTDGGAITLPTNELWSITIIPDFITGNNAWRLVNGDGSEIGLDMEEPIVISYTVPAYPLQIRG